MRGVVEWASPSGTKQEEAKANDLEAARVLPSERNHVRSHRTRRDPERWRPRSRSGAAGRGGRRCWAPSGHSASAFAFATAVGDELPLAWLPLHALATAVA